MTTISFTKTGEITWVGDAHHKGTDIYYSERLKQWVVVDLENKRVSFADRLAVYSSEADGDDTGLNRDCVACDLDGQYGFWVVALSEGDDASADCEGVDLVFDTASL